MTLSFRQQSHQGPSTEYQCCSWDAVQPCQSHRGSPGSCSHCHPCHRAGGMLGLRAALKMLSENEGIVSISNTVQELDNGTHTAVKKVLAKG